MPPITRFGPFLVDGPLDRAALIERALARLDSDVDVNQFIKADFTVVFGAVPNVPGTNSPAYGFFRGGARRLLIRHGVQGARNLHKVEAEYTFLHEAFGHGGEFDGVLNTAKRQQILNAMGVPISNLGVHHDWKHGDTPQGQTTPYWHRPFEAYADMLVSAISDVPSIFERRYTWDIDPDALKAIVVSPTAPDPIPDPPADPDPLPTDEGPEDGADAAALAILQERLNRIRQKASEILAL